MQRLGVAGDDARLVRVHSTRDDIDRLIAGLGDGAGGLRLMDDLYRENILEHYKQPHNWGELPRRRTSSSRTTTRSAATS